MPKRSDLEDPFRDPEESPRLRLIPVPFSAPPISSPTSSKSHKSISLRKVFRAMTSPVKTRREKKELKALRKEQEERDRVANIEDFLATGRLVHELGEIPNIWRAAR
ncbi:hypothetical protein RUND412_004865 [Rhizina undulata]